MNYCQTCRRHLNGVVSCPGCGAAVVAAPEAPEPRTTDRTTGGRTVRTAGFARPGSPLHVLKAAERETAPVASGDAAANPPDDAHRAGRTGRIRRSGRRRGLGLGMTVIGGFAGIAVIGLLAFGNAPAVGADGSPVGAVAAESTSASSQSTGAVSASDVSVPVQIGGGATPTSTPTGGGTSGPTASANASTTGAPSHGASETATGSAVPGGQAGATQPTARSSTTAAPGTQGSSPSATRSTTTTPPPAPPTASPSPSQTQTQGGCFLIICW